MQAISLWQPWASLLCLGMKKIETRHWPLKGPFPRVLAIHATRAEPAAVRTLLADPVAGKHFQDWFRRHDDSAGGFFKLPRGAVVGLVRVEACVSTDIAVLGKPFFGQALSPQELAFGDYSPGRFAWACDQCFALSAPVPCRGRQSLFAWEPPPGLLLPDWAREVRA